MDSNTEELFLSRPGGHGGGGSAQELEYGQRHFFHPCRMESQFSTPEAPINSIVTYDKYDLLVQETCDALGNRVTVGERDTDPTKPLVRDGQDYRLMTPWLVSGC